MATTVASLLGVPIATTVTVVSAPVWAVPVAVAGGVVVLGSVGFYLAHKKLKNRKKPLPALPGSGMTID